MNTTNRLGAMLGVACMLTLAGCQTAGTSPYANYTNNSNPDRWHTDSGYNRTGGAYAGYGVVQAIDRVPRHNRGGANIGIGTVAGAVVGGVLGNQVGSGTGNTSATVAGVAGGAYTGHQYDVGQQRTADDYRYTIRMENGTYQTVVLDHYNGLREGERVRIDNGSMQRY